MPKRDGRCQWTTKAGHGGEKKKQLSCRVSQSQQEEGPSIPSHPAPDPPILPRHLHKLRLQLQQFTWGYRAFIHHYLSSWKKSGPQRRAKAKAKNSPECVGQGSLCKWIPEFLLFSPYYAVPGKAHAAEISPCAMPPGGATDLVLLTSIECSQDWDSGFFLPISQRLAMLLHGSILSYHFCSTLNLFFFYTTTSTFSYFSVQRVLQLERNWEKNEKAGLASWEISNIRREKEQLIC